MGTGDLVHAEARVEALLFEESVARQYILHTVERVAHDVVARLMADASEQDEVSMVIKIGKQSTSNGTVVVVGVGSHCDDYEIPNIRNRVGRQYRIRREVVE